MTKTQLLQKVSEEDILKRYLPEFTLISKNYKNPFSPKDNKPSLSFYQDGPAIKFKCHNTAHAGDVFQFVAYVKQIDCKTNFPRLIDEISKDFKLNGYSIPAHQEPEGIIFEKDY